MHYYKRNIGDYHKKAGRLSILEHGAYTLLMDACYDREQFPTKDQAVEWTWARTPEEVAAVEFVLSKFFVFDGSVYVQSRISEEVAKYQENAKTNKRIANDREQKRKAALNDPRTKRERSVNEAPPNHKPITNNQEPNTTTSSTHVDRCPTAEIIKLFADHAPSLVQPRITPDAVKAQIAARWRESPEHQSLEFWREFFRYCEQSDFLAGRSDGRGAKPFRVGLEWVVKSSNFAKIINGNYHGESATA